MQRWLISLLAIVVFSLPGTVDAADDFYEPLPPMVHPPDNPWSLAKEDLGRMLYFDPRLSGSNWISCATCHHPGLGWSDGLPRALGNGQKELGRHSPTVINSGYFTAQFWDGRGGSLEEQAKGPIAAKGEMNQDYAELVQELAALPGYVERFDRIFGKNSLTIENIARAIATFERSVVSKNSPYDRYQQGDRKAMTKAAVRGMTLFFGKARCVICHNGPAFTDNGFHNIGVKPAGPLKQDLGRFNVTRDPADKGAFKTPGLRHVTRTAPYMHNGAERTLQDVVEFYNRGGDDVPNKSGFMTPLDLSAQEKQDIVEFMQALEGEPIIVALPQLPN
ncbi:MAG: cytochrome-c peroxidase [Nitrospinaceae bacterium]